MLHELWREVLLVSIENQRKEQERQEEERKREAQERLAKNKKFQNHIRPAANEQTPQLPSDDLSMEDLEDLLEEGL